MKRKVLTLGLALVLAFSSSSVALAVNESQSQDVAVKVVQKNTYETVVDWGNFDFVYDFNLENENKWDHNSATVTVTNNSTNASINVSSKMENKGTVNGVTINYTGDGSETSLAAGGGNITYTVSVSGTPANLNRDKTTVGVVTVTIS